VPVILSVPQVDVIPDEFDWVSAITGIGGFAAAIVAIWLARRAQRTADSAIADERRRVFELEILRELMRDLGDADFVGSVLRDPRILARYSFVLNLLSSRLPTWDRVIGSPDMPAVIEAVGLGDEYRSATEARRRANQERESSWPAFKELQERLVLDGDSSAAQPFYELERERNALLVAEQQAERSVDELLSAARVKLSERLVYDVNQAVLSRVEARRHNRLSWWYRV
jgi:hypothetical protein